MSSELSVKDMLANLAADIDRAQATIDEARVRFKHDLVFQQQLDEQQIQLDFRRKQAQIMKVYANAIDL